MSEQPDTQDTISRPSQTTALWFVVGVLLVGSFSQWDHNKLVREQIAQIHDAQLIQIKEGRRFEERMVERTNALNLRIAQLETANAMWEIPYYRDPETGAIHAGQ